MMPKEREEMHKIDSVPYYSQFLDVKTEEWKNRSCTMACLKMAMECVTKKTMPSIDKLYSEALKLQDFLLASGKITKESVSTGLLHDVIVRIAHNYLVPAHKEEYRSMRINLDAPPGVDPGTNNPDEALMLEHGINMTNKRISEDSPVIVSVRRDFQPDGTNHSILLTGYIAGSGFYYSDPDNKDETPRADLFVSKVGFLENWRGLAIFVDALPK